MSNPEQSNSRYIVGIDLGTTNSAVAFVDTEAQEQKIEIFSIPQLVAPYEVGKSEVLPSCHYEPAAGELGSGALKLPWQQEESGYVVGLLAKQRGAKAPGRMIASAKSWLCHAGVDRTAPILPWHAAADVTRLSPVEASARYLAHIRAAWDYEFPDYPLAEQDIVLTLPASFDEVARELTVKAARLAGLPRVVLLEEPQAAFYAWIYLQGSNWQREVQPGQKILVCDIGGGTTDFTLIRVRETDDGKLKFHRIAVGEHLILGGDNMDFALAHFLEQRIAGQAGLEPAQWAVLVRVCQMAKEQLLAADGPEEVTVNVPGTGSKLLGAGLQARLTRREVLEIIVDGFFPRVPLDAKPRQRTGFQEFGLPYAPDPAVTKYLAAFLTAHRYVDEEHTVGNHDPARPDIVLFNGGVFASQMLQERVVEVLADWFRSPGDSHWRPKVLVGDRLDLAVARGAAYYGLVRRGIGVRIAAGLARTYYVGVAVGKQPELSDQDGNEQKQRSIRAVCIVPAGVEPGQKIQLTEPQFQLLVSQPVEFPLYVSSTRLTDKPGQLVDVDPEQMRIMPPIRTVIKTRRNEPRETVPVHLAAHLTEIGTMELWCRESTGKRSWKLEFDVRAATRTDVEARQTQGEQEGIVDEQIVENCRRLIEATFGPQPSLAPQHLMKELTQAIGAHRELWPGSLLRSLWQVLLEHESGRQRSPQHESRWLNLCGFALRPGFGLAMDDWRVDETWKRLHGKLLHNTTQCRIEWFIFWRRIAGGLSAGQQQALADPLLSATKQLQRQLAGRGGQFPFSMQESAELWRLLGALELLLPATKVELGDVVCQLLTRRKWQTIASALLWTLARLGARKPVYGPLNCVVDTEVAWGWLQTLMKLRPEDPLLAVAVMQLARRTGDRYRDLSDKQRAEVLRFLDLIDAPQHLRLLVEQVETLDAEEQRLVFGESLPVGLQIG